VCERENFHDVSNIHILHHQGENINDFCKSKASKGKCRFDLLKKLFEIENEENCRKRRK
jgi:hypothetical protein